MTPALTPHEPRPDKRLVLFVAALTTPCGREFLVDGLWADSLAYRPLEGV
jgi:hypothetical protein